MKKERAIFAAGCFWGVESIFQQQDGVLETTVGYIGGKTENPTYPEVCRKNTGHAEAVEIIFDPDVIGYSALLDLFWRLHDPTTLNRQGPDIGDQYRSAVFYTNEKQKAEAEAMMKEAQKGFPKPIVTQIVAAGTFYAAEDYHQDYLKKRGVEKSCHFLRE